MHVQIYKAVCLYDIENQLWLASALDISPPLPPPFFFSFLTRVNRAWTAINHKLFLLCIYLCTDLSMLSQ